MFLNKIIISIFLAWFIAQGMLKTITRSIEKKKFYWRAIFECGGMPSGHAAFVAAVSTAAGMVSGFDSMIFYVALVFSILVVYETLVTKNAVVQIVRVLSEHYPQSHLIEKLGHTLIEIIVGAVIGSGIVYIGLVYF
jgi:acid phosphatase family membrane protein YuiD